MILNNSRAIFFVIAGLYSLLIGISEARSGTNEGLGLWTSVNLEKGINEQWTVFLGGELRLKENLERVDLFYLNTGLEYKAFKNLKTSLSYGFIEKLNDKGFFSFRHRVVWDVILKKELRRFNFSYRQRFQMQFKNVYSSELGYFPELISRNRFQMKYEINKYLYPYISLEFRQQIRNAGVPELNGLFYQRRYLIGLEYRISSRSAIEPYYFLNHTYNVVSSTNASVIGIQFNYKL